VSVDGSKKYIQKFTTENAIKNTIFVNVSAGENKKYIQKFTLKMPLKIPFL
jgi:hypothetical protein